MSKRKENRSAVWIILVGVFVAITALWGFTVSWVFRTWANLQLDELIYELSAPLTGTNPTMIVDALVSIVLPTAVCVVLYSMIACRIHKKRRRNAIKRFLFICSMSIITLFAVVTDTVFKRLDVNNYINSLSVESTFIENHYVDPAEVAMVFPQKKKNLIYIFLESMETTYAAPESGGAMEDSPIKELVKLAQTNEDFSGEDTAINGAHVLNATSWTMGGMFAQMSGLPLKISIEGNSMSTQEYFFPDMVNLGDILEEHGYCQTLLIGSDAIFGGRDLYFTEHGNYSIKDYKHAIVAQEIPADYYVWWGYEDYHLFELAKKELLRLSKQEEPFNLTLLTVDTHFEDGYLCTLCGDEFDEQYSNVFSCSSRQIDAFVKWVQEQDFYQDTAIVLVGDHLTMDADYCKEIDTEYDRKVYTAFINADAECALEDRREYSTFDFFPTTLAALGVEIEGNRLGLGTNLFSDELTLVERYGVQHINDEIRKDSLFMKKMAGIQECYCDALVSLKDGEKEDTIDIRVCDIDLAGEIESVEIEIRDAVDHVERIAMTRSQDRSYTATVDLADYERAYAHLIVYVTDTQGKRYQASSIEGNLKVGACTDIDDYLTMLKKLDDCVILVVAQDEASNAMSDSTKEKLKELGLENDWTGKFRYSYYGVVSPDSIVEDTGLTTLQYYGTMEDGTLFMLRSSGFGTEDWGCNINIDGEDYALHQRGLNFAVYDLSLGRVVDHSAFDTFLGEEDAKLSVDISDEQKIQVKLFQANMLNQIESAHVCYWNKNQLDEVYQKDLTYSTVENAYEGEINNQEIEAGNMYMVAYGTTAEGKTVRLTEMSF